MAKALRVDPFPPLTWDGWDWRGTFGVPWFPTARAVDLVVRVQPVRARTELKPQQAPAPAESQAAAFRDLLQSTSVAAGGLLAALHQNVPELEGAGWDSLGSVVELSGVSVFHAATDGLAYVGFVLSCLQWEWGYEHGFGVVAHGGRVAYFGFAEAADESEAVKDIRRSQRAKRGSN